MTDAVLALLELGAEALYPLPHLRCHLLLYLQMTNMSYPWMTMTMAGSLMLLTNVIHPWKWKTTVDSLTLPAVTLYRTWLMLP